MLNDFRLTPCHGRELLWFVTPTNTAALCWMLCHTTPEQRRPKTVAILNEQELSVFSTDARVEGYTIDDTTPPARREEVIEAKDAH